ALAVVTQPVTQGTLASTVTATGTVNPQNTVNVGTQVSGTISQLYVDYNSKVKKGQVLARLDPTAVDATLAQDEANLAQSQAQAAAGAANATGSAAAANAAQDNIAAAKQGIASAQAQIAKDQAADAVAQKTVSRDSQLLKQGYIAQSQYDTDQSNAVAADATLKAAQIAVTQAQAQEQAQTATAAQNAAQAQAAVSTAQANRAAVDAQQAQVAQAKYNLNNTVITSPVNGTVVARDVSVGQTVAAGFQTPTLFAIAQDLTKMEVDLQVGEPDIGNVRTGDQVQFTVLAYPTRTFTGTVSQVRENPTTVQNVVTYTAVVLVDNKDSALLPGMTANATIETASLANATIVPVAALQWRPSAADAKNIAGGSRSSGKANATKSSGSAKTASPWGSASSSGSSTVVAGSRGRVFVETNGKLQVVPVQVAMVSGTNAAVTPVRGTLKAGDTVVTADGTATAHAAHAQSSAFGGRSGGGGMHLGGGLH
ncbi:MAG: efflux RND transporter periplasmic adaptor subunit, partial [Vulcanimicrobiaceae bacterium]